MLCVVQVQSGATDKTFVKPLLGFACVAVYQFLLYFSLNYTSHSHSHHSEASVGLVTQTPHLIHLLRISQEAGKEIKYFSFREGQIPPVR